MRIYSRISRNIYGKIICKVWGVILYPWQGLKQKNPMGAYPKRIMRSITIGSGLSIVTSPVKTAYRVFISTYFKLDIRAVKQDLDIRFQKRDLNVQLINQISVY